MNNLLLEPLRRSLRNCDYTNIRLHLDLLIKKAAEYDCDMGLRVDIYLEAAKAYRLLGDGLNSVRYCELGIVNIPANAVESLDALKRFRALLYLDAGEYAEAETMINSTDCLEVVGDGGASFLGSRNDNQVQLETWLISCEIALTQGKYDEARKYLQLAEIRMANDETDFRSRRQPPSQQKGAEIYFRDLRLYLELFELAIASAVGDTSARTRVIKLQDKLIEQNASPMLLAKISCLAGQTSADSQELKGITRAEAARWSDFAAPKKLVPAANVEILAPASETLPVGVNMQAAELNQNLVPLALVDSLFTSFFKKLEGFAPKQPADDSTRPHVPLDFEPREFSSDLRLTDLGSFLNNFDLLNFTGYLRLNWHPELYHSIIIRGEAPEALRSGCAYLYVLDGSIIDAVFENQAGFNDLQQAQDNFVMITRMCFKLGVDDIAPKIIGTAILDERVRERHPLMKIRCDDLLRLMTDIEKALGITFPDDSDETDDLLKNETTFEISSENEKNPPVKADFCDDNILNL